MKLTNEEIAHLKHLASGLYPGEYRGVPHAMFQGWLAARRGESTLTCPYPDDAENPNLRQWNTDKRNMWIAGYSGYIKGDKG